MWFVWLLLGVVVTYNTLFKRFVQSFRLPNGEGKAVVITGCDTGFGRQLALRCARFGFLCFAGCFSKESCESLEKEAAGAELRAFELDVRSEESVAGALRFVRERLGDRRLHALVNNAGVPGVYAPIVWCPTAVFEQTLAVNFFGIVRMVEAFGSLIREHRGRIVNMGSVNGKIAVPFTAPYCASKTALNGYTDCLRRELRPFGVSVVLVEPSFYKTPLMALAPLRRRLHELFERLPVGEQRVYGREYVDFLEAKIEDVDANFSSPAIHEVVDAQFDALVQHWPEPRSHPGLSGKLLFVPAQFLSTHFQDLLYAALELLGPQPPVVKKVE
ncbi:hypothetical protein M3Y99_01680500 [Aphelenchoides fujianensis]|nr:hypothetical protein M3Y99_01680500 [Aphelenchoides fujianensis]